MWDYKKCNLSVFHEELKRCNWDTCFESEDVDKACKQWTETFLNVARSCIPNRLITVRPSDKMFFTSELRRLRRKKNRCHRKAKITNSPIHWEKFRSIRNLYNKKLEDAKLSCETKKAELLRNSQTNQKKWWHIAKSFVNKKDNSSSIPPLQIGDTIISDDQQKAEKFNNFFLKNANIDDSHAHIPPTNDNSDSTLSNIHVKTQDVADLLKCLNVSKATGPDIISHSMLKMAGDIIAPSLQ